MKRLFVWLSAIVLAVGLVACQVEEEPEVLPTIAEIAVAEEFTLLVDALTVAELVDTFADAEAGPFTVFAPTDDAFVALLGFVNGAYGLEGDDALESLDDFIALLVGEVGEEDAVAYLTDVLFYHVVGGAFFAEDVVLVSGFNTLLDQVLEVNVTDEGVFVGNEIAEAQITATDIEASNGVIHVIDFVLLPELPLPLPPE